MAKWTIFWNIEAVIVNKYMSSETIVNFEYYTSLIIQWNENISKKIR